MSESIFLHDSLALGSFAAAWSAADEDDSLPAHIQGRVEHHVHNTARLLVDFLLLALSGDLGQLVAVGVRLKLMNKSML